MRNFTLRIRGHVIIIVRIGNIYTARASGLFCGRSKWLSDLMGLTAVGLVCVTGHMKRWKRAVIGDYLQTPAPDQETND